MENLFELILIAIIALVLLALIITVFLFFRQLLRRSKAGSVVDFGQVINSTQEIENAYGFSVETDITFVSGFPILPEASEHS